MSWLVALGIPLLMASQHRAASAPEPVSVALKADKTRARVAEPVEVALRATAPRGWTISLPEPPEAFGDVKVIATRDRTEKTDERIVVTRVLRLEAFAPGRHRVEVSEVQFSSTAEAVGESSGDSDETIGQSGDHEAQTLGRSPTPLTIRVTSALGPLESGNTLRPISGPVAVPWTWWQWTAAFASAAVAGLLAWTVWRQRRSRGGRRLISQAGLLDELDRLDRQRLEGPIGHNEVVIRAAELLRRSLAKWSGERVPHRTTGEWIGVWSKTGEAVPGSEAILEAIESVLSRADAVTYAGTVASLDDSRECVTRAREVVVRLGQLE